MEFCVERCVGYFMAPKELGIPVWDARYFELKKEIDVLADRMWYLADEGWRDEAERVWAKLVPLYREMEDYLSYLAVV